MLMNKGRIRIMFNDAYANLPSSKYPPQGGPSRFIQILYSYFKKNIHNIELISILFSNNHKDKKIYLRETNKPRTYYEVVYPSRRLNKSYKKEYTKKEYIKFLNPWLTQINKAFELCKPDIVFLNGFSLSNWMILEIAHRRKIPVCIQHAGIWKKEILVSKKFFSSSVMKIFIGFEKEIIKKASHQIFLNEFSKNTFLKTHNINKTKEILNKISTIPLPTETHIVRSLKLDNKKSYIIGMVARWDGIKNHNAMIRLATYIKNNHLPFSIKVVTKLPSNKTTEFRTKYKEMINIVSPMDPNKLRKFYSSLDLLILPSKFDTCGAVVMESILSGVPVVLSSSVGWVNDYHKFKLSKLVFSPNASGEKISNVIKELISNKKIYLPRFIELQKRIIKEHNPEKVFEQYYKIFKKLS